MTIATSSFIPRFHFPKGGKSTPKHEQYILNTIIKVRQLFNYRLSLSESQFIPVAEACGLPRYLNMAFFRKLENIGNIDMRVTLSAFIEGWTSVTRDSKLNEESLFFNILKKSDSQWISPDDFLPVLEDVVFNHPGLMFLGDNAMFQERYIETVICRIFYEANCASGRMNLSHFKKSGFVKMIKSLGPEVDLNNTRDCFSYKHFYVLYCKFWVLDEDHDLIISENDLLNYNDGVLSQRITRQVMHHGCIPAFSKMENCPQLPLNESYAKRDNKLTYIDYIWFLLSETDKSTTTAIEYWFQCMDQDSDGVVATYDLAEHWDDQDKKLQDIIEDYSDERILFDDLIRQLNDLIQPEVSGQFRLKDLKRNGIIAERFFDTFINIEKFQIHDTYQGLIRSIAELQKQMASASNDKQNNGSAGLQDSEHMIEVDLEKGTATEEGSVQQFPSQQRYQQPFSVGSWCEYAEQEYDLLILSEQSGYVSSDCSVRDEYEQYSNSTAIPDDEVESPTSSNSGDLESELSSPSTPVMQDLIIEDCHESWIKNDDSKNSIEDNNKLKSWSWHSAS
ncbi:unnamed protein product [Mucor hiemalis]